MFGVGGGGVCRCGGVGGGGVYGRVCGGWVWGFGVVVVGAGEVAWVVGGCFWGEKREGGGGRWVGEAGGGEGEGGGAGGERVEGEDRAAGAGI